MSDAPDQDREEYLRKTGTQRPEDVLPPDERTAERRQQNLGPPGGFERRKNDRRKVRANVGRERYLDMILRERALLAQLGHTRSAEQLLSSAGAWTETETLTGERDNATGDQLRANLPVQSWMPLSIHLVQLEKGVLTIAPLYDLTERQINNLKSTATRIGFKVDRIEIEMWDRAELVSTLQAVHDLSADRCEKTLSIWLSDIDNGLFLNQFQRDMLAEALQMRASDIHLLQDNAPDAPNWIKYRIDGDLMPMHLLPADAMARLTTLIKRDAGLNFGDRSLPKDGRFSFIWQGRSIDVRVAAGPQSQDGEKITLRLLDRAALRSFDELFARYPAVSAHLSHILAPEMKGGGGLLLMSGPTGSGKSTTLYACVLEIDRRRRHVLSIEDPIEYEMRYATQWQVVGGQQGREFSDLIRAAMRHDPDYIIIGEMRDKETVDTALKAAESGHTVISTIHADTAIQTLERLRSFMPIERERSSTYTLAQQIRGVLNQRLIKTLCHGCSNRLPAKDVLTSEEIDFLKIDQYHIIKSHNAGGCDLCNRTGILGRALLLEALMVDTPLSQRDSIFRALLHNINDIVYQKDVIHTTRTEGVLSLVRDGMIDPKVGLILLRE